MVVINSTVSPITYLKFSQLINNNTYKIINRHTSCMNEIEWHNTDINKTHEQSRIIKAC